MSDQTYPKWIYYYLCFVTVVSVVFAIIIYVNPAAMWGHWRARAHNRHWIQHSSPGNHHAHSTEAIW